MWTVEVHKHTHAKANRACSGGGDVMGVDARAVSRAVRQTVNVCVADSDTAGDKEEKMASGHRRPRQQTDTTKNSTTVMSVSVSRDMISVNSKEVYDLRQ